MATFTLEQLGDVVEKKYAPFDIDMGELGICRLLPILRLPDEKVVEFSKIQKEFQEVQKSQKELDADGNEVDIEKTEEEQLAVRPMMVAKLNEMIRCLAENEDQVNKFLEIKGNNLPYLLVVIEEFGASSQLGEASASPSS